MLGIGKLLAHLAPPSDVTDSEILDQYRREAAERRNRVKTQSALACWVSENLHGAVERNHFGPNFARALGARHEGK